MSLQQRKERVAILSVTSNSFLVLFKVIVGILIGSVSIISEAIHSGMDLLAAIIAMLSVKKSNVPADDDHPFGHGKIENISGLVEAALIFVASFWIIYEALRKISSSQTLEAPEWGVAVMLFSSIINYLVSRKLFQVAEEADSIALRADGWHLRTDVYTSVGVMFSLGIIWVGHYIFTDPKIHWLDPLAAIFVAFIILRAAYELTVSSIRDLIDVKLPSEEEDWIQEIIVSYQPPLYGFHQLRTRKAGHFRFIEFHIKVNSGMSVVESHKITKILKSRIKQKYFDSIITIHIEPCEGECSDECIAGCLLPEEKRSRLSKISSVRKIAVTPQVKTF